MYLWIENEWFSIAMLIWDGSEFVFFSYGPTSSDILRLEGTGSWWLVGDSRNGLSQDLRPTIAYTFGMWWGEIHRLNGGGICEDLVESKNLAELIKWAFLL